MSNTFYQQRLHLDHMVVRVIAAVIVSMSAVLTVRAQSSATDGATPAVLQPGAPAGSYALSGLDNVNLYNGNLNFRLPLGSVIGRGEAATPIMLPIERKWRVVDLQFPQSDGSVNHLYMPGSGLWKSLPALYNPGTVEGRRAAYEVFTCADNTPVFSQTLTRLTFTAADGTEFELRDTLTNGRPGSTMCNYLNPQSRGTVFVTADGTAATFISDQTIYDASIAPGDAGEFSPVICCSEMARDFESMRAELRGYAIVTATRSPMNMMRTIV